jgi:N-acetylglucosamine-6-phosphate deacetylase
MWIEGRLVETGHRARVELAGAVIGCVRSGDYAPDLWIAPGFLDIQVNGYAGYDANAADVTPEVIVHCVQALWHRGVAALCPTVVTQSEERMCRSLRAIAAACDEHSLIARSIPCIHMEGPYISPEDGPRGAHPLEHVRLPSLAEYRRWQEAADGRVGIITLAPELSGALEFIEAAAAEGVVIAIAWIIHERGCRPHIAVSNRAHAAHIVAKMPYE